MEGRAVEHVIRGTVQSEFFGDGYGYGSGYGDGDGDGYGLPR